MTTNQSQEPKLQWAKNVASKLRSLQLEIEGNLRSKLDEKREWWNEKSDKWQESEKGLSWDMYLDEVEELLDDIENITIPDSLQPDE